MKDGDRREFPKRGEIYLVSLGPVGGSEIGKARPALVISNNQNNQFADTVTVLPLTSKVGKVYPFEVFLPKEKSGLPQDSKVKSNQIRTVDKRRLIKLLSFLSSEKVKEVEHSLLIHLGINPSHLHFCKPYI